MAPCIFCEIINGDAPAWTIYENEFVIGFLDIRPVRRGHTLIVPKTHCANLAELSAPLGAEIFNAAQIIAAAQRSSAINADGVNLMVNDGKAAFQTVFHHHLHVVPRHHGDKLNFAKGLVVRRDHSLENTAEILRTALHHNEK